MSKLVLTVDDSAAIREMLAYVLKSAGHRVIEAEDGMEGLQKALANQFDLIITDQSMPKMDGITLVKALRALPQYTSVPILLLTTESSDGMKDEGRSAGATGWLVKPFDPNKLIEVVEQGHALARCLTAQPRYDCIGRPVAVDLTRFLPMSSRRPKNTWRTWKRSCCGSTRTRPTPKRCTRFSAPRIGQGQQRPAGRCALLRSHASHRKHPRPHPQGAAQARERRHQPAARSLRCGA